MRELPPHLAERTRPVANRAPDADGEFVLYWMHHAVRAHENPALDVAIHLAASLDLPLLVYQGLGGCHPYNNDRHHTFILEGAREAHLALAERGVRAVFHLPFTPETTSPLRSLSRRSAVVVTEAFPAPPFKGWTRRFAAASGGVPWLAVDSACLLPIWLPQRAYARAYEFRRDHQQAYGERLLRAWPEITAAVPAYQGELGFAPLDLMAADISTLCARCAIDHSVPPVPDTPGGSTAGYARWEAFRREGLGGYHRLRNDAAVIWPRGVSRLSPYLHHGQVSPFRIAREAHAHGGAGADKFLDELLVWRELAFNFCQHQEDPESLAALPEWARATLEVHAGDPREILLDDERLARSQSGDLLWDLAQTSLRIHGELHNNLRMTWAKALLRWRPDPTRTLRTLIALNHRFALDGSDPNSYGGLLWTLGLFDRPFTPERPVSGRLRTRSTREHLRRLDLETYLPRIARPASSAVRRFAVIGAGVSGLVAAGVLQDHGHEVTVFEKARGLGGRAATRRCDSMGFDHGAQYFTARDPRFRRAVEAWLERGAVAQWRPSLGVFRDGRLEPTPSRTERYVAVPGMSRLGRELAADLTVHLETCVAPPLRRGGHWLLTDSAGAEFGAFDGVIVATPAPQAADLLGALPELAAAAQRVAYQPTWAVLLAFAEAPPSLYSGIFFEDGPLSWAAANASKPGRSGATWVLHSTPAWAQQHIDTNPDAVIDALAGFFCRILGADPGRIVLRQAHRWLYSTVPEPLQTGALWDARRELGACGDWCQGARIEGAYLSGQALAGRVLGALAAHPPLPGAGRAP